MRADGRGSIGRRGHSKGLRAPARGDGPAAMTPGIRKLAKPDLLVSAAQDSAALPFSSLPPLVRTGQWLHSQKGGHCPAALDSPPVFRGPPPSTTPNGTRAEGARVNGRRDSPPEKVRGGGDNPLAVAEEAELWRLCERARPAVIKRTRRRIDAPLNNGRAGPPPPFVSSGRRDKRAEESARGGAYGAPRAPARCNYIMNNSEINFIHVALILSCVKCAFIFEEVPRPDSRSLTRLPPAFINFALYYTIRKSCAGFVCAPERIGRFPTCNRIDLCLADCGNL